VVDPSAIGRDPRGNETRASTFQGIELRCEIWSESEFFENNHYLAPD
jgi:hypothetical protein